MSRKILLLETTTIPDLLLEMDGLRENIPLWIIEVNFLEPEQHLMEKVQHYAVTLTSTSTPAAEGDLESQEG